MRERVARRIVFLMVTLLVLAPAAPPRAQAQAEQGSPEVSEGEPAVLSLQDCIRQALENNLDIAVSRFDPLRSEALIGLSQAAFDPLVTGSTQTSDSQSSGIDFFNQPFSSSDRAHSYSVGYVDPIVTGGSYRVDVTARDTVSRSTSVFSGLQSVQRSDNYQTSVTATFAHALLRNLGAGSNRWRIVVARNNLSISESQFRSTVIMTVSTTEQAYWDLNFTLMDLKTKRQSLQLAKDFLEQNRIKVRVGTLAPIEITQAEAGVADREEAVILAENAVRTAEDALRQVMSVPQDSPLWSRPLRPSDAPPLDEVAPEMEASVKAADENRPDLEQARLTLKNQETELGYRRNQRRWGLDFTGTYGLRGFAQDQFAVDTFGNQTDMILSHGSYGDSVDDLRDRNQPNWTLGLLMSVPIGNRAAIANYTNVENARNQARFDLQRLEQGARVEVRNAVRLVETNLKRVKAARVNVRLQREKLDAEQKKFENGMSTAFQVLSFQTDLASAESRENQAIVDYNKSQVELERVKGTLLEARKIVVPEKRAGAPRETRLPTDFVFTGRNLVGLGGAPAVLSARPPAGR